MCRRSCSIAILILGVTSIAAAQAVVAPFELPQGFAALESSENTAWENTVVTTSSLTIGLSHPAGWRLVQGSPVAAFVAQAPDASMGAFLMMPTATTIVLPEQGTVAELREAGSVMAEAFGRRQLVAAGQTRVGRQLWIWFDLGVADAAPVAGPAGQPRGLPLNHLWVFSSVIEGHQVILNFVVGHQEGDGLQVREADTRRAGPTFVRILQRLTFARRL